MASKRFNGGASEVFNVRLKKTLLERLKMEAKRQRRSLQDTVRIAIEDLINKGTTPTD